MANIVRKTISGNGTYKKRLRNIADMIRIENCPRITIRINLTKENYLDINTLFVDLNKIDSNNKLTVYPDIIVVDEHSELYLDDKEKIYVLLHIFNEMCKSDMRIPSSYRLGANCMYKNNHSITIGADGELYKCYSIVGNRDYSVSNINCSSNKVLIGSGNLCQDDCEYIDICNGGCPYNQYVKNKKMFRNCNYEFMIKDEVKFNEKR